MAVVTPMLVSDKMTVTIKRADAAWCKMARAAEVASRATQGVEPGRQFDLGADFIRGARAELERFAQAQVAAAEGARQVGGAWGKVKQVVAQVLDGSLTAFLARAIVSGIQGGIQGFNTQYTAEVQLAGVMKNAGSTRSDFESVLNTASARQSQTTFGDESLIAGAAALSTYLKDAEALQGMMGTLTDYAAGVGGISADPRQMTEYATQLGKALNGTFDDLQKKGFSLSDAQKEILATGTELERVAVISDVVGQAWGGLSESLALTPAGEMEQYCNRWGNIAETVGGRVVDGVLRLMGAIDTLLTRNTALIDGFCMAFDRVSSVCAWLIEGVGAIGQVIGDNWGVIEPILAGIVAGMAAWMAITQAHTVAVGIHTAVTWLSNEANRALIATMLANPALWVAIAIGVLIAALYAWAQSVGGVQAAWLIFCDYILSGWDAACIGFAEGNRWLCGLFNKLEMVFAQTGVAIVNWLGDAKVDALTMLQGLVNGAIDILNGFIGVLNSIPGVQIDLIGQMTFATSAQLENAAAKQARAEGLAATQAQLDQRLDTLDRNIATMKRQALIDANQRQHDIATAKAERALRDYDPRDNSPWEVARGGPTGAATGGGLGNLGGQGGIGAGGASGPVNENVSLDSEDLKLMRDVAEMRYVQNFVTMTPTIAINAQVSDRIDLDDMAGSVTKALEEFSAAAEEANE